MMHEIFLLLTFSHPIKILGSKEDAPMKVNPWKTGGMAIIAVGALCAPAQAQVKVDPKLPEYKAVKEVSGTLKSVGSHTMLNEMTLWADGFSKFYPKVQAEITGEGATRAPYALIAGTIQIGFTNRPMKQVELDGFKKKYGYLPVALPTSIEMLGVFVHKDNPIKGLTLQQVDAIFSKTRKGGYPKAIKTWADLGLKGEWAEKPILLIGRNSASPSYEFFRERVLLYGDFRDEVKEQPGGDAVNNAVANHKYSIGFGSIHFSTNEVRAVPLAKDAKSTSEPARARAYEGNYPLKRELLIYLNHKPGTSLDPLHREFLRYVFSKQGQTDVVRCGHFPIDHKIAAKALATVGIK
jgi:phosphate transport system substrate-binding protein